MRPLLLQERIDGLDVRIQELVRNVAKKILFTEETSNKSRIEVSNATAGNFCCLETSVAVQEYRILVVMMSLCTLLIYKD